MTAGAPAVLPFNRHGHSAAGSGSVPATVYLPGPAYYVELDSLLNAAQPWLRRQVGPRALLISPLLLALIEHDTRRRFDAIWSPAIPQRIDQGAVIAIWPTRETLESLSPGELLGPGVAVCVLEPTRHEPWRAAWLRARDAVHAGTRAPYPGTRTQPIPVRAERALATQPALNSTAAGHDFAAAAADLFAQLAVRSVVCDPDAVWAWTLAQGRPLAQARLLHAAAAEASAASVARTADAVQGWEAWR